MATHQRGYEYDLVTLGAGSGGTRASRFAAQYYGAKVACVELPFGFVSSGDVGGALGPGAPAIG
jgi:glutathione reductase (NADPH)